MRNIFPSLQSHQIPKIKPQPRESSSVFGFCAADCLLQGAREDRVRLSALTGNCNFFVGKIRGWFSVGSQPKLGRITLFRGPRT
ncbi:hypothetical protein [Mesorhizobium sp. B2-8-9]|uniref:hypothetical protein n=1 Tax=Mesorhizobium sp. B2-8-9 TaxID=2589899 RepID=UPI001128F389|nr:hypothetical protein [Mesorhizobium sp. B2-8-9]TPI85440.1 hypothetical protein FJ423_03740 [Mesorhizobium sp. B2-8-9]